MVLFALQSIFQTFKRVFVKMQTRSRMLKDNDIQKSVDIVDVQ